jgi:CHAD domain-containing protein
VGAVLALVDPALSGHVESVHDFRVAARSLRAALRTLTRRPDSSLVLKTRDALRTAIRALADVRDRDVGRSLILKIKAGPEGATALRRRILGLSESDRRVALTRSQDRWPKGLDRLLIGLLDREEPALSTIIRRTRAEAWQQRRRALALIQSLGRRYDPEQLHEIRIRIRRLRYALEVLAEVDSGAHTRLILLKPLQSALGNGQDRIVLSRWLSAHAARFRRSDAALASALRREAMRLAAQSRESHAAFLKLRANDVLERLALHVDPFKAAAQGARGPHRHRARARIHSTRPIRGSGSRVRSGSPR